MAHLPSVSVMFILPYAQLNSQFLPSCIECRRGLAMRKLSVQIKSNQIKFICDKKKNIMQHKKTKLICRQDTTALTSALQNKNTATGI